MIVADVEYCRTEAVNMGELGSSLLERLMFDATLFLVLSIPAMES